MIARLLCFFGYHKTETILSYGYTDHLRCTRCGLEATVNLETQEVNFK